MATRKRPNERLTTGASYSGSHANPRRKITAPAEVWELFDAAAKAAGYAHTSTWMIDVLTREASKAKK